MKANRWIPTAVARHGFCALVACLLLAGCRKAETPESVAEPLSVDESVLLALEPSDPVYKVNARGRVILIRLEGRQIPASALEEVGKLTELTEELSLYRANITDDSLAQLESLKKLQRLGLGGTPISAEGLATSNCSPPWAGSGCRRISLPPTRPKS